MDMVQKFKPTVAISHAEGCVINSVISAELAQKIFRLVTDELNGTGEGPKIEQESPEHCRTNCTGLAGIFRPHCYSICSQAPIKTVPPKTPREILGKPERTEAPGEGTPICAVEDCPEPVEEGQGVCIGHGGGEPKGIPNETLAIKMETKQLPLCACGCGYPVAKKGNKFLKGHNKGNKKKDNTSIEGEKVIINTDFEGKPPAIPTPEKKKSDEYAHLKTVPRTPEDLLIVEGRVMCPKATGAVECEGLTCIKYIATIKTEESGEPHIRCAMANPE